MKGYEKIRKAFAYISEKHKDQIRFSTGYPYITHCLSVYSIVKTYKQSKNETDLLCASLLHDVLEDCDVSYDELKLEFGEMTASIVQEVTNDKNYDGMPKLEYMNQKLQSLSNYALVIKLADILDNISDLPTPKQLERYSMQLKYLLAYRQLTESQKKIAERIIEYIN